MIPSRIPGFVLVFALCFLVRGVRASDDECLECHEEEEPIVDMDALERSVHGEESCTECHADAEGKEDHDDEEVTLDRVDCMECHEDEASDYLGSVHEQSARKGDEDAARCTSCHGEHDVFSGKDPQSRTNRFGLADTCAECHEDEKMTEGHELPEPSFIAKYRNSVHGRGVQISGLLVSAVCTDCHGHHAIFGKDDERSKVHVWNVPETCSSCHEGIMRVFWDSSHGELWEDRDDSGPVCTTCHTAHGIAEPTSRAFQLAIARECGECHEDQAPTFLDNVHGQMYSLGFMTVAKCSDCHTPHASFPADDPRSTVHPGRLLETCGNCHEGITASYATYDPHMNPSDPDGHPYVHAVWLFFVVLLIGTLAFFGVHYMLWAQRVWVGQWRGEFDHPKAATGRYLIRFHPVHRWVHGMVIVSFLTLALTGFALKFNSTGWAQLVTWLLGGIETMRWFHRVSAVVSIGYTVVHFVYLLDRVVRKREWGLLWGWQSMVPRLKDLKDFGANLRWFLYLGPPPSLDRWAYWEKIEYLAELWGVPVITLSGLALWFPEAVARFLPGWVLNAAQVVHTYEAFLAVSYVVLFHYFVAHLRPDVFPVDVSIFTGKISLERFKTDRTDEYERMLESGTLNEHLTEPPTLQELRRARMYGVVALVAGAAIMAGIVVGLLQGWGG